MKKLLLVLLVTALFLSCKTTNIYVVRHGEKAAQPADNPHLTDEGKTRAMALRDYLKDKGITMVYATNYHRTQETGKPTAEAINRNVHVYRLDSLAAFVQKLKSSGENTLVVGHSNSVLTLLDAFPVTRTIQSIPDNDYDNLFIITSKNGKVKGLRETTYGKVSP